MRLMHIYTGHQYGGIERLLITMLRLRDLSPTIEPSFLVYPSGDFKRELEMNGAAIHELGLENIRLRNPLTLRRARSRLREIIRAERIDVVAIHSRWLWLIFAPGARASGVPAVLFLHERPMHTTDWVTRWTRLTPPDLVVCHSHYVAGSVPTLFPGVPVEMVYQPVEPAPADQANLALLRATTRAELGGDNDTVVIIQACRPSAGKGNLQLVRALAKLRDLPQWICLQVGQPLRAVDVQYFDEVRKSAADLLIAERVRFLGYRRDPIPLLAAADIHCQPNIGNEAFGIVFVEALYAGLPVVATAMGGPQEIVDESCGLLVPAGDTDALAEALGSLIRDPALRRRLGAAGPARARRLCDPSTQMAQLESLLLNAVSHFSNPTDGRGAPND